MRKIIHIDMDAFFASVEQRDNPKLRNIPIAVCYDHSRSVVTTASYEARRFGVHSAMPVSQAKKYCPHITIVKPNMEKYKVVSKQIHKIFHEYTDIVEPISLDEAFLDVTINKQNIELATDIAKDIKKKIYSKLGLYASAGISYNKFLAKIASDYRKPNGCFLIHPKMALNFIKDLPIEKFWGIGSKTANKMHKMGIYNGEQLRLVSIEHLKQVFGKSGELYYMFAQGIDNRIVEPYKERKSVGCEETFLEDLHSKTQIIIRLYHIVLELIRRIEKEKFEGYTLVLKVKWDATHQTTRSTTVDYVLNKKDDILHLSKSLLTQIDYHKHYIRLIGLSVTNNEKSKIHGEWIEGEFDF